MLLEFDGYDDWELYNNATVVEVYHEDDEYVYAEANGYDCDRSLVLYDDFIITPQVTSDFMERREILMGHVNFLIENDMLDYVR